MAEHPCCYSAPSLSRRAFLATAATALTGTCAARGAAVTVGAPVAPAGNLGAYVNPANQRLSATTAAAEVARFESLIGRRLGLRSYYVAWEEEFPTESHRRDIAAGRTPLLAWYPPHDLASVATGRWDSLVRARARATAAFPAPLLLRFAAEFNGRWSAVSGRQGDFISGWRRLVRTFRSAGADNVGWIWCPSALEPAVAAEDWRTYWPGDSYVDWVGMDGHNWGATRSWSTWRSFEAIFSRLYGDYQRHKPIIVCEVASSERGGDKSAWIRDMHVQLTTRFSAVKAVVWFDTNKETDWRVNSSPGALAAFRALAADRRLG